MTLENTFYVMAIVFMTLSFLILIAIGVLIFYIKTKIDDMYQMVEKKINQIENAAQSAIPDNLVGSVGTMAVTQIAKFLGGKIFKKR